MDTQEIEAANLQRLSQTQNLLSDLADDSFSSLVVVAIKSDGSLVSTSYGNPDQVSFLSDVSKVLSTNLILRLFEKE